MEELDILILGAGWTAEFLIPLLQSRNLSFAATTTTGRRVAGGTVPTIPFRFGAPDTDPAEAIAPLPRARHILITFPLSTPGQTRLLVTTYTSTHQRTVLTSSPGPFRFIQLGSTGIWNVPSAADAPWLTRHSPFTADARSREEDELLALDGCVLNLSGLWGGPRDPKHWVDRVATTKEAVRGKKSLHMIHGVDVARAICAVVQGGEDEWQSAGAGQRWMVTDGFVYDWWALFAGWAELKSVADDVEGEKEKQPTRQAQWVYELMAETGVRALPRSMEALERCYDTREFWTTFGLAPLKGRI
ncbi:hypothetical protein B0T22DRAFT_171778 [Podospora appendiculata]|uniref:Uncharacterized protein n=1 Tax=Podospora appendiculata TaxID=314037 RepID=A0AAE1CD76_9PEZI|nr:hypothetical protein B0T22DRAFT_171778 [Podospora appendiculata]